VGIASSSGVFPTNEPLLARQAAHMKKTFNRIKTDRGIKQESVVQTFSCAISPLSRDRMAVLQFPVSICGVEDASIAFLDSIGGIRNVHSLLVIKECIQTSVLHVPEGATELRVSVCVLEQDGFESISGTLTFPGKIRGLLRLALYVYKINRFRGVTIPRFFVEKCQQLYRIGFRNLISSPTSHVELRDFAKFDYKTWIRIRNENLTSNGNQANSTEAIRICFFLKFSGNRVLLQKSLVALTKLKVAAIDLYLIVGNEDHRALLNELLEHVAVPATVVSSRQMDQAMNTVAGKSQWCCFLNEGDVIREHALCVLSRYAESKPEIFIFYCDHDYLDQEKRHSPWFKPAWNREYYLNFNYISRAVFYRPDWLAEQGIGKHTSYIHERLILKLGLKPEPHIERIPDVLFSFSCPDALLDHDSQNERQIVVSEILHGEGIAHSWKKSIAGKHGAFVDYQSPSDKALPAVSLIIPIRDQPKLLKNCLDSILGNTDYPDFEVIIVDNGSTDPRTIKYLSSLNAIPACTVLSFNQPFNYSAINNFAARQAKGELIGLVNSDIEVISPGWLRDMASYFWVANIGIVGAKLLYRDESVQHAGVICGLGNVAGHAHRFFRAAETGYMNRLQVPNEYSAVTGACLLTRRSLYETMGGLNSRDLAIAYNDVDYCIRVRKKGYRIVYCPQAELFHFESVTRGREDTSEKKWRYTQEREYMWNKWRLELEDDEFYNPNLSRVREDFSIGNKPHSFVKTQ
jgi:GT2 family glycosyltransferase